MAILTTSQLISASNATYVDNNTGSITPDGVRALNDNWISSSILAGQTGSMSVAFAVSASNALTASYVLNAVSSSYASNADLLDNLNSTAFVSTSSFTSFSSSVSSRLTAAPILTGSNTFSGNNTFTGVDNFNIVSASFINARSASIDYLSVIYQTSSIVYSSGSNIFGDAAGDTQTMYGTVDIKTGPLTVTGSTNITGAVFINNNVLQVTGPGAGTGVNYSGNTLAQIVGADAAALDIYIANTGERLHVETAGFSGSVFQDVNGQTYNNVTWLSVPSNLAGTNPAPQFPRGIAVANSVNITGSFIITGSVQSNVISASIASNTASLNFSQGNFFTSLVSGSTNFNITNPKRGQTVSLLLNTVGTATASFSSNVKQISGSAYTPSIGSGKNDILTFISWDGTTVYLASVKNLI